MTTAPETRVGWCPGALRPMPSGDGLIVRVKPRGATLSPAQAMGIAAAASAFGNGALDLTNHANLQIRGASDASFPALTEALDRLGLLDPDVGAETRRNVMMSPLAGFDPEALLDIRPIVGALENRLVGDAGLAGLPSKFGFTISDGGRLPLGDVGADVTFDAGWLSLPGTGRVTQRHGCDMDLTGFAVRLAGDATTLAFCPVQSVPDVASRLAGWFIMARGADPDLRRMRHAVERFGASTILDAVGLRAEIGAPAGAARHGKFETGLIFDGVLRSLPETGRVARSAGWGAAGGELRVECLAPPDTLRVPPSPSRGGIAARAADPEPTAQSRYVLAVAAPFGRHAAAQLDTLARGALTAGASELRLTPWRSILVPGLTRPAAERFAAACAAVGFITDPGDPRLRVAACPGAPGCHRGTTPVLDHAARWAAVLGSGRPDDDIVLHVSGCAKGCAHPTTAPLTLVAEEGRYQLFSDGISGPNGLDADAVQRLIRAAGEGRST